MSSTQTSGIHWEFYEAQKKALDALETQEYDIVDFRGGYGSGKSILGSSYIIKIANEVPGGRSLVLAQNKENGKTTTYNVLFDRLPGENTAPLSGGDPTNSPLIAEYSKSDQVVTFANGHSVQLGSARNWNTTAGAEYNNIWCDEVAHYSCNLDRLLEMLVSRQRTEQGPNTMLWTTTGDGFNQYWRIVKRGEMPDGEAYNTAIESIVADTRNNPFLPNKEKLVNQYEGTSREKEALMGGFSASEGRVYGRFLESTHVVGGDRIDRRGLIRRLVSRLLGHEQKPTAYRGGSSRYGYAFSGEGGCVCIELRKTTGGQLVVMDEFVDDNDTAHVSDVAEWIAERPRGHVYAAPQTSEYDIDIIEEVTGGDVHATGEDTARATPLIRREFEVDPSNAGVGGHETEGTPQLIVTDECGHMSRALLSHSDDDATGKSTRSSHTLCCDALKAAVHKTPIPDDD